MSDLVSVHDEISSAEWDRVTSGMPYATFRDTSVWGRICEEAFPGCKAGARLYTFDDGTEVLIPGVVETAARGRVRVFKSTLPSNYGGLLANRMLGPEHVEAISHDLRGAGFSRVLLYESPFSIQREIPGFESTVDFTQAVRLNGSLESFMQGIRRQERQAFRRSQSMGVRVEVSNDERGIEEFYRLYLLSAERWGESTTWLRPIELLRSAVRWGGDSVRIRLAVADDIVLGGQVDYFNGRVCTCDWRAFDYDYRGYYPNAALLASAVQEACERGMEFLDMCPSGGLAGVEEAKARCGAARLGFRVWGWENKVHRAYRMGRWGVDRAQDALRAVTRR